MIRLIEALRFRCLRYVRQPMGPFHVLVGPNASGKTTFLDVVAFLGQLVSDGPDAAIRQRTQNLDDLLWNRQGDTFELAIEVAIPEDRRKGVLAPKWDTIRYEVRVGRHPQTSENGVLEERVLLKAWTEPLRTEQEGFPSPCEPPETIMSKASESPRHTRHVLSQTERGDGEYECRFRPESSDVWMPTVKASVRRSILELFYGDDIQFPVSTWLKNLLTQGVQELCLNSLLIRKPSRPGQPRGFQPDGSNIPWLIHELEKPEHKKRLNDWISHLRTVLPDIEGIRTVEREEDRHRYLKIKYQGGLEVPSWMVSDGTLRMLALTLPAYLPEIRGVYLIEEPENGVHPSAIEAIYQSLSSVYEAQILLATHSPVILSMADAGQVLCFKKTEEGATDIIRGRDHPALRDWQGDPNLSVLFAAGVLG